MSEPNATVVVGATRKELRVQLKDADGVPLNLPSATARIQGKSRELTGTPIDVAGSLYDAGNGVFRWVGVGSWIDSVDLGSIPHADYTLRVRFVDNAGLVDFSPELVIRFERDPLS